MNRERADEAEAPHPQSDRASASPVNDVTVEDIDDAQLDGDRPFSAGTARAALSYSSFRRVYAGSVSSNVGSWMQAVVLNAFAYELTQSATFVAVMNFAIQGPLLLSVVGGSFADRFDRRRLLIIVSFCQAAGAFTLAFVARSPDPSKVALLASVFAIGMGQAVGAPTFSAVLPSLVQRRDLPGAVSLMSVNFNLSRAVGAALGPLVYAKWGVSWVFGLNALTYFFIIAGVYTVSVPRVVPPPGEPTGVRRVLQGFSVARHDEVIGRCLITCAVFSFFSLFLIGGMPAIATENLGMEARSAAYGVLYSCFGLGAMAGALSIGTFLAGRDLGRLVRIGFLTFGISLTAFSLCRSPIPAYPTVFLVGFFYFMAMTSLTTVLQSRLSEHTRGRVMAIWITLFGGLVAVGPLVLGPIAEHTSVTVSLLIGAVVALVLAFYTRVDEPVTTA